jgi:hypothetical protein
MTQLQQTSIQSIVDGYFAIWNEPDQAQRRARIAEVWSSGANYVDPMFAAQGAEALEALVAGLHQNYPGHSFRQTGSLDLHHDRARWGWDFLKPDGTIVMSGVDFAVLDADGKLRDVTGFFQQQ